MQWRVSHLQAKEMIANRLVPLFPRLADGRNAFWVSQNKKKEGKKTTLLLALSHSLLLKNELSKQAHFKLIFTVPLLHPSKKTMEGDTTRQEQEPVERHSTACPA